MDRHRRWFEPRQSQLDSARGDAYGFGGVTQNERYIAGKLAVAQTKAAA